MQFRMILLLMFAAATCSGAIAQQTKEPAKTKDKKKPVPEFRWVNPMPKNHHPALSHRTFPSESLGVDVGYVILLPPEYETSTRQAFPVVYYLHGGRPGSETKSIGLAKPIFDAMKNAEVSPAIYVFVNGGPVSHYDMPDDPKRKGASVFTEELIPHIDANYRTIADRSGRGIEGFSQGGRATMRLSLRRPDLFCSAAAGGGGYASEKRISEEDGYENPNLRFSLGENTWDLARSYAKRKSPVVRWMIYVGDQGFNYQNNLQYMEFLDSLEIPHQRIVVPGATHSAKQIYDAQALTIMKFHAANFVQSATVDKHDGVPAKNVELK
ncbi:Endo-1,4-beta-xylanase/feruloyl esterase precursor [Rubripirellula lacrimiformis]|uniref:Endo-1,4-beta-xylanase/feruloyl esterase n=1 Tax=Rubripirellula lacrimiformis TaxID=1930273 RepID=A0A517NCS9_9BACT|nr:alpha/beta hydrolase-fold protein [Rubripirellula lacrimiformis]QDT04942.1 Endo-1,4-beta-xylanase/feruloyl esterase precursor [Rubripirellula lacrimiformis]